MRSKYYVYEEDRLIAVVHGHDPDDAIQSACSKTGRHRDSTGYRAKQVVIRERCRHRSLGHLPVACHPKD